MDTVVDTILTNAALATLLAAAVATLCLWVRWPAVARFLWLLVLLRLAVPSLFEIPLPHMPIPVPTVKPAGMQVVQGEAGKAASRSSRAAVASSACGLRAEDCEDKSNCIVASRRASPTSLTAGTDLPGSLPERRTLFLAIWGLGAAIWCGITTGRIARFSRWLRRATAASPQTEARARRIARRLGLRTRPRLLVIPGKVPPSLWALGGRACILLPGDLLKTVDFEQHDMLLAHELSHYRRRDHWCRWFETVLLGVYWWHPVAWWARSRLVQAEEQCCDANVLELFPGRARKYAETLLATVEFLVPPPVVAPVATGIGIFPLLKRRLEMILHDRPRQRMTPFTLLVLAVVATAALGISPALQAEKPASSPPQNPATTAFDEPTEEVSDVPKEFDRELARDLHEAFSDFKQKQIALTQSKRRLLATLEKLQPSGEPIPDLDELREFDKREATTQHCFARLLAANDEVVGRRAVLNSLLRDGSDYGDAVNLYLNALQRKAEAYVEYGSALTDLADVSDLGGITEQQMQKWRALNRLEAAVEGRDATLKVWKVLEARRKERAEGATIQCESQARTQYWAFQELAKKCEKECLATP